MTAGFDEQAGRMLGIALVTCSAAVFAHAGRDLALARAVTAHSNKCVTANKN